MDKIHDMNSVNEKTLVIYNSLRNDISFVKWNVDKEIKYNPFYNNAVISAKKYMQCHISTKSSKPITITFILPSCGVLVPHEFINLYESSKSAIKLISEKKLYIYGNSIEIPHLMLKNITQLAMSCNMWKSERDMRSLLSYFLKTQEIKNFMKEIETYG